jgi:hypothetical protein
MPPKPHAARAAATELQPISVKFDLIALSHLVRLQALYSLDGGTSPAVGRGETIRRAIRTALLHELERRADPHAPDDPYTLEWVEAVCGFDAPLSDLTETEREIQRRHLRELATRKPKPKKGRKR